MKQQLAPKIFGSSMLFIMGTVFFILFPLWIGLCLIAPIFLMSIRYILSPDVDVQFVDHSQRYKSSSSYTIGSSSYSNVKLNRVGSGCNTLYQRKNLRGF